MPAADSWPATESPALRINDQIPEFTADAYYNNTTTKINSGDYRGKWMVFIFYPADFTFVCPTELEEMAGLYKTLPASAPRSSASAAIPRTCTRRGTPRTPE